eukprot:CAMPEP_0117760054 /NCGR_PEP_ID=MMETSP0947-20121206/16370_1 /TAXON_ID=44440 /ORGANISM="Chattonella subsalsa, Strain CCMP2191" /LENGTH=938 /DNA_ID=CAMNT_0005580609 /DNA_START=304 /DNA_END=3120 /DNA_ORIENTATION=-
MKLAFTYRLFQTDSSATSKEEQGLSHEGLMDFLHSFLMCLCALILPEEVSGDRVAEVAEEVSREVANMVLETIAPDNNRLSFEDFGGWYNSGGFEIVPWLELLDLGKWSYPVTDTIKKYFVEDGVELMAEEEDDEEEDDEDDDGDDEEEEDEEEEEEEEVGESDDTDVAKLEASPAPDAEEEVAFEFVLDPDAVKPLILTILPIDVAILQRMAYGTSLAFLSVEDVGSALLSAASADGILSKRSFDRVMRKLVPAASLDKRERDRYSTLLATVFLVFDRDSQMEVDVLEFISGFMLFCSGSKSIKLAYAFELLDEQSQGWLSRRGVWRYFRSILSMLAALCSSLLDIPTEQLQTMIDDGAVWTTAKVFSSQVLENSSRLTFDELAAWYTGGGYQVCPWLELLDLRKWQLIPNKESMELDMQMPDDDEDEGEEEEEEEKEEEEEDEDEEEQQEGEQEMGNGIVFTFPLSKEGTNLCINAEDIDFIEQVSMSSGFAVRTAEQLMNYFITLDIGEKVTKAEYDSAIRLMVPERFLTEDDKSLLSFALSNIFFSYDPHQSNEVSLRDLMCGLSLLCAGTKSAKLAFTFQLYAQGSDDVGEPVMTAPTLMGYLTAFLTGICACTAQMLEMQSVDIATIVFNATSSAVEKIFEESDSGSICFEDFGNWYNSGGFQYIPWLELLDLTKWVPGVASIAADLDLLAHPQEEDEKEDAATRFQFVIKEGAEEGVELLLTEEDVDNVQTLAEKTGLRQLDPKEVCNFLLQYSQDGLLEKKNFDRCIRRIVPGDGLSQQEKAEFSSLLSACFYAFDRDGSSQVDVLEFMSGFTLLCAGNKSSKLAFAFDILDEDEDGRLSRRGLWRFLRSFLAVLMSCSIRANQMLADELITLVDNGAVWTAAKIFQQCNHSEKNNIDFEELAAWYTEGGYKISPWLELLDLKKWMYAEQ